MPHLADVRFTVYNSAGRRVQKLVDSWATAGEYRAILQGAEFPAGVYLLRLEVGNTVKSMKVVLLK